MSRHFVAFCGESRLTSLFPLAMTSVFRFRRNIGDDEQAYAWLEATGHKYELDNRKRTKCFVLSAREKVVDIVVPALYPESSALLDHITLIGGADSSLKWCKVTLEGLVLYSSKGLNELLDDTALYARKLWEVMDPASAESAREAFAEMKRAAKSGGHSMPRFAAKLKKGKGWIPTIVELHCVGTYPTNAVFAAIELLTDETKDLAEGSTQEASWSADAWPLLEVQNQSSLQHKQNWLRTQNRKLADSLMGLV